MVDPNVRAEIAGADKLPVTDVTLVGLLACVREDMRLQISRRGECFRALLALVRSLARMNPHVPSQIAGAHEGFGAVLALVWFLARVRQNVPL